MQSLILCRKDKLREESDARGNVSGRGGVWPRGELRRIVKRWKKMEYVSRWICVVRISGERKVTRGEMCRAGEECGRAEN